MTDFFYAPQMTLHIFNPEHDIALAANLENFTAPHAARQLRHDLGFLPAIWANDGDAVLVDDVETAKVSLQRFAISARRRLGITLNKEAKWQSSKKAVAGADAVNPWGWDTALRARLRRLGIADSIMPDNEQLHLIRNLSHRRTATQLMGMLRDDGLNKVICEVPVECCTMEEVECALARHESNVIKAPWSSSGRGLRFVGQTLHIEAQTPGKAKPQTDKSLQGWLRNVLKQQGSVMVEPYYNKVKDIGMEFMSYADGHVDYCGLSLFHTTNGAYTGNILATEHTKREMTSRYIPLQLIDKVSERICHHLTTIIQGQYCGPIGVDMMVCPNSTHRQTTGEAQESKGFMLHPCVEINLRRTMGHVALALMPTDNDIVCVMRIEQGMIRIERTNYELIDTKKT